jgi:phosphomannomutase
VEDRPLADQGEDEGDGALLAGELSGHICFGDDYYGFDDALYAACRWLSS